PTFENFDTCGLRDSKLPKLRGRCDRADVKLMAGHRPNLDKTMILPPPNTAECLRDPVVAVHAGAPGRHCPSCGSRDRISSSTHPGRPVELYPTVVAVATCPRPESAASPVALGRPTTGSAPTRSRP